MKQLSLVTMVCGTVVVLAPVVYDLALLAMLTHLLARDPNQNFHLQGVLDHSYQGWCLFIGISLFIVGIVSGFSSRRAGSLATGGVPSSLPAQSNP